MSDMGKVVAEVGERMYQLQAKEEGYKAGTASIKSRNQILLDASQDVDTKNEDFLDTYNEQFSSNKQEIMSTIRNPLAQQQFSLEYDRDVINSQFKLKNLHNKRVIDSAMSSFVEKSAALQEQFYAGNDKEKAEALGSVASELQFLGSIGAINNPTVKFQEFKADLRTGQVEWNIFNDMSTTEKDSKVLPQIKSGKEGVYKDLTHDEKIELVKKSQQRIFQNNQSYKREVDNTEADITARRADKQKPQPTVEEIVTLMDNERISPSFAKVVIKDIESIAESKINRGSMFSKLSDFITNPKNKEKDIREELILQRSRGEINDEELNILYTFNQEANKKAIGKVSPQKTIARSIIDWSNSNAGDDLEERAKIFIDYMTQVNSGVEPEIAVKEAIKQGVIRLFPAAANAPEEGVLTIDALGNLKIVKPNGEIEAIKSKGTE